MNFVWPCSEDMEILSQEEWTELDRLHQIPTPHALV
jgi:hypothetical protein